jgi:BirA family biotin operon repressor/biotin-[acetyl-CoA-carboxylase] ligase
MPRLLFETQPQIAEFSAKLKTQAVGRKLEFHERTHSTNDLALAAARNGADHGTTFVADFQDGGRGRRGRTWESPGGLGLLFSVVMRPDSLPQEDWGWAPLLAGLACSDAIGEALRFQSTIKWPNDIVVPASLAPGWRKLGGILCESVLPSSQSAQGFVVIGIGLNVNHLQSELPRQAKAPPSSLRLELDRQIDRLDVLHAVLQTLERRWMELRDPQLRSGLKGTIEACQRQWWGPGTILRVEHADGVAVGTFAGLDEFGRLRVRETSGREVLFADAEVVDAR